MGENMVEILKFSRETAFNPEAIQILAAALDEAWERLRQSGSRLTRPAYSRAMREVVAKCIMEIARRGVEDREAAFECFKCRSGIGVAGTPPNECWTKSVWRTPGFAGILRGALSGCLLASLPRQFADAFCHDGIFGPRQIGHVTDTAARLRRSPHAGVLDIWRYATHATATAQQDPIATVTLPLQL
jgi:hypothetical protein